MQTSPQAVGVSPVRRLNLVGIAILAIVAVGLAYIAGLPNYYLRIADFVLIYILLGIGLNIVIGYAGLLDLGFVAFYAVGAYTYALLASPQLGLHLPFLVILPIAALFGAIAGILLGVPVLRLRGDYLAIVTLGFGEIIRVLINNADNVTNGPQGVIGLDRANLFGWTVATPQDFYWLLLGLVAVVGVMVYRLQKSLLGKAWFAIREDQDAAEGVGINKTTVKLIAFATSAMIGSIAGVLFAGMQRFVSPESFSLNESVLVVLIIVIGGIGNILGVVVGALVLIVLPEMLRGYSEYRMLIMGLVMMVLIVLRPRGLLPEYLTPGYLLRRLIWK